MVEGEPTESQKKVGEVKKKMLLVNFLGGDQWCDYLIFVLVFFVFFYFVLWYTTIEPTIFIYFPTTWSESKLNRSHKEGFLGWDLPLIHLILSWSWNVGGEHQSPGRFFFRHKIQLWWSFFEKLYSSVHLMVGAGNFPPWALCGFVWGIS